MARMLKSEMFGKGDDFSSLEYILSDDAGRKLFERTVEKYGSPNEWIIFRDPALYKLLAENSEINEDYTPSVQSEKPKSEVWDLDWARPQTSRAEAVSSVRETAESIMRLSGGNENKKGKHRLN
jgi:hypothetical protein